MFERYERYSEIKPLNSMYVSSGNYGDEFKPEDNPYGATQEHKVDPNADNEICQNKYKGSSCSLATGHLESSGDTTQFVCDCHGDPVKCRQSLDPSNDPYCCGTDKISKVCCNKFRGDCRICPYDNNRFVCNPDVCALEELYTSTNDPLLSKNKQDLFPTFDADGNCPSGFEKKCINVDNKVSELKDGKCVSEDDSDPVPFCMNTTKDQDDKYLYFVTRNLDGSFECNSKRPTDICKFVSCTEMTDLGSKIEMFRNLFRCSKFVVILLFILVLALYLYGIS